MSELQQVAECVANVVSNAKSSTAILHSCVTQLDKSFNSLQMVMQDSSRRDYMDILNQAQRYVHIMTPYLIMDNEMETSLKFAAERGVEVILILPGVTDSAAAHGLAWTHYASLLDSGVKIYEYTPGFVHAKVFVSDDREAVVGTINMDYRSLYHHFECAAYLRETSCISEIEQDFQQTLLKCSRITPESAKNVKFKRKILGILLKAIAPLM